jgi:ubiquinone/menaquinone biosynthesis C-methylase UbiE
MNDRLRFLDIEAKDHIRVGSALDIPFETESFDFVYSIGCLHHTGNLHQGVEEVYRVLKPRGKAVVMLYNRHSFRQMAQIPYHRFREKFSRSTKKNFSEWVRSLYDTDASGQAAPHTDYVSRANVKRLFKKFAWVKIDTQNFDDYVLFKRLMIPRKKLLNNLGRIIGLDLYVVARK